MYKIAIVILLAGCTTYYEPMGNAEPWEKADSTCYTQAAQVPEQPYAGSIKERVYRKCMLANGWRPAD